VILTKEDEMVLTPTYYVFKMYSVHQDATLVPENLETGKYSFEGKSIPKVQASSSIKDGVLSVTLCNLDPNNSEQIEIVIPGSEYKSASGQIITAENLNDYNDFGKAENVALKDFSVAKPKGEKLSVNLPSKSVVLIQFKN